MATPALQLLDRAVQGAIAVELGDGEYDAQALAELGVAPRRHRVVGGLRVVSNAMRDADVDKSAHEMTDRLLRYRADRELVRSKLARVGVEPVAVLPLRAWADICDSAKLYRFTPVDGTVPISASSLMEEAETQARQELRRPRMEKVHKVSTVISAILFWAALVTTLVVAMVADEGFAVVVAAIAIVSFFVSLYVVIESSPTPEESQVRTVAARILREHVVAHEAEGTLLEALWPDQRVPKARAKGTMPIAVSFPDPPAEVQERIVAAERTGMALCVAVVGEAVTFRQSVAEVLLGLQAELWAEQDRQAQLDPIVYVVEGTAVAIIDQYGDFPIEKEVMNRVINSDSLV